MSGSILPISCENEKSPRYWAITFGIPRIANMWKYRENEKSPRYWAITLRAPIDLVVIRLYCENEKSPRYWAITRDYDMRSYSLYQ